MIDETSVSSSQELGDLLRGRIRLGKLVPGQRLVEADITRETGIARAKVREALRRLESEGLVVIEEFRGASVKRISFDEVRQIYRTRMALEGLAAREFALADDAEQKALLGNLQAELNECAQSGNHEQFARLNSHWHRAIIEGSKNTYVGQFLERLVVPVYRLLFTAFYSAERIKTANGDHKLITQAILDGDADRAEAAMREHVEQGLKAVSEIDAHFSE